MMTWIFLILNLVFFVVVIVMVRDARRKPTGLRVYRSSSSRLFWRLFSGRLIWRWFPELDLYPRDERGHALRRAGNNWKNTMIQVPIVLVGFITIKYFGSILQSSLSLSVWAASSIEGLMLVGLILWGLWLTRGRVRRKLRQELIDAGFAICGPCGYNLHGLTESRCPECGAPFDKKQFTDSALKTEDIGQHENSEC